MRSIYGYLTWITIDDRSIQPLLTAADISPATKTTINNSDFSVCFLYTMMQLQNSARTFFVSPPCRSSSTPFRQMSLSLLEGRARWPGPRSRRLSMRATRWPLRICKTKEHLKKKRTSENKRTCEKQKSIRKTKEHLENKLAWNRFSLQSTIIKGVHAIPLLSVVTTYYIYIYVKFHLCIKHTCVSYINCCWRLTVNCFLVLCSKLSSYRTFEDG